MGWSDFNTMALATAHGYGLPAARQPGLRLPATATDFSGYVQLSDCYGYGTAPAETYNQSTWNGDSRPDAEEDQRRTAGARVVPILTRETAQPFNRRESWKQKRIRIITFLDEADRCRAEGRNDGMPAMLRAAALDNTG